MSALKENPATGPGAWSKPYPFASQGPSQRKTASVLSDEPSPMCLADITAGGGCGSPLDPVMTCPLNRALEPTREIEPDVGTGSLDALYGNIVIPKENNPLLVPRYCDGDAVGCQAGSSSSSLGGRSSWWILLALIVLLIAIHRRIS
jgi:hypothetical protein